ncbi:hypothetical protein CAL29_02835 [Bordetella genomosp. 10]|uniref:DUF2846 domain-containing protein n=2 Tax=Bordetella genomosp. 10 TaxID=1416804 RepID=A0A261SKS8_9BORD|nr:hypothetical protein CAL29_02835 [Bordetella genomosp. 10]
MPIRSILFTCLVLALTGCGAPMVRSKAPAPPSIEQSQVIFLRNNSFFGGGVNGTVYDATDPQSKLIGTLAKGTNLAYTTTPGHHLFMIVSEAADFLEADLAAGKVYYAQGIVRMGALYGRFSLWPAYSNTYTRRTLSDKDLSDLLKNNAWMELTPASAQWFEQNRESIEDKRQRYWAVWQSKRPEDIDQRTLHPNDGVEPGSK